MTRASAAFGAGLMSLGAGLMYFFDPDRGSPRRTHAHNQLKQASHRLQQQPQLPWPAIRGGGTRRAAMAVATAAGLGFMARAARNGHVRRDTRNVGAVV